MVLKGAAQNKARLDEAIADRDRDRETAAEANARVLKLTDEARDFERKYHNSERQVLRYELTGGVSA